MPLPLIAAAIAVIVAAALVYFFTSNRAAQNRTEYERKVQAVLDLLKEKLKRLKKRLDKVEAENNELKGENESLKKESADLKAAIERIKSEKAIMEEELARWKDVPSSSFGRIALLRSSPILASANFLPSRAITALENRQTQLTHDLCILEKAD